MGFPSKIAAFSIRFRKIKSKSQNLESGPYLIQVTDEEVATLRKSDPVKYALSSAEDIKQEIIAEKRKKILEEEKKQRRDSKKSKNQRREPWPMAPKASLIGDHSGEDLFNAITQWFSMKRPGGVTLRDREWSYDPKTGLIDLQYADRLPKHLVDG